MNPDPRISPPRLDAAAAGGENDLDFLEMLAMFWRRKWSLLFWVVLFGFLGGYYASTALTKQYLATAVIALDDRESNIVAFDQIAPELSADFWSLQTEVELLQSRKLLQKVVAKLDLTTDPEFNLDLARRQAIEAGDIGLIGRVLSLFYGPFEAPPPEPEYRVLNDTIDRLLKVVNATNVRNTRVFHISVLTSDPEKSALIADTMAELHILNQLESKFEATQQATTWLTDRVAELKTELETVEAEVKEFNSNAELVSPETLEILNRQLKDFRDRSAEFLQKKSALDIRIDGLVEAQASGDIPLMATAANDAGLTQLSNRITSPDSPLRAGFDARFSQILERARFEQTRLSSQSEALKASIVDIERQVAAQSGDLVKLEQLQREAEASRVIYEYFLGRLKEAAVQQGIQQADSQILSNAVSPKFPSSPRTGLWVVMMALFGLIVGIIVISVKQLRRPDFRSSQELERFAGVPVLGRIPRDGQAKPSRLLRHLLEKPASPLAETVRDLRTSILLSNVDHEPQIIMLTSSVPREGKTTQSVALAESMAGMRKRVLLIEGDLRRRTLDNYFESADRPGLVSVVAGKVDLADAVLHHEATGIDALLGERTKVNAANFFSSDKFRAFLHQLRAKYDVVIIDTPPVLVVPDARLVAQHVDAALYVVRWGSTPRKLVSQGLSSLGSVNVKVTGLIFSQVDQGEAKKYGEYFGAYGNKQYTT